MINQRNALTNKKYFLELIEKRIHFFQELPKFFWFYDVKGFYMSLPDTLRTENVIDDCLESIVKHLGNEKETPLFKELMIELIDKIFLKFTNLDFTNEKLVNEFNERLFNLFELEKFDYSFERMARIIIKNTSFKSPTIHDLAFLYKNQSYLNSKLKPIDLLNKMNDFQINERDFPLVYSLDKGTIIHFVNYFSDKQFGATYWTHINPDFLLRMAMEIDDAIKIHEVKARVTLERNDVNDKFYSNLIDFQDRVKELYDIWLKIMIYTEL